MHNRLADRVVFQDYIVDGSLAIGFQGTKALGGIALRIEVNQQDLVAEPGQGAR